MGLFSKKEDKVKDVVPSLPELPPLPSMPDLEEQQEELPKLPSFSRNNFGERFSQDTIKKAINGKKEEEKEITKEYDSAINKRQMIQESPRKEIEYEDSMKFMARKMPEEEEESEKKTFSYEMPKKATSKWIPEGFEEAGKKIKEIEPIFVRIDKFEESRRIFEKMKGQILEIERALEGIKSVKQEEERQLGSWEQEIMNIKDKISQIEKDIFSKV